MALKDLDCTCATAPVTKLTPTGIEELLREVHGWKVVDGHQLRKEYVFAEHMAGVAFVQKLSQIAEEQNHHPDILLTLKKVRVDIYTHVVNGISKDDFILAAKYDALQ
jgi:4a-hydroxytetrahydrobiopterin dehydratase